MGREGKNWRGLEPGDDVLTTRDKTHAGQRYLQAAEDLRCCSWCFEQIFEDKESFLLQRKCAMSASVENIFFWARLIILVRENEPKLKETTVNYFEFRHQQSFEDCTLDTSELVNQDARIVWASLISSLEVARYDYLLHHFSPNVSTSFVSRKNWKEKSFSTRVWTCNFLKLFLFWLLLFHDCPLAGNTRCLFEILSVIWFGNCNDSEWVAELILFR